MERALELAKEAYAAGEVPIGAVIVLDGQIIGEARNRVEELQDVQAHAEMLAMRQASALVGNWRLLGATLYCTLEPCAMCAGAILLARLKRLVYAAPDKRLGASGSYTNLFIIEHPFHQITPEPGLLVEESAHLMRSFFQERRNSKGVSNSD